MSDHTVFIGIGSNIEPFENIKSALVRLQSVVCLDAVSPFYRSKAVGNTNQPDFINGACRITTTKSPTELKFELLRNIEADLGRIRTADKNASRPVDLDILLFDNITLSAAGIEIPDPMILQYPFVYIPLLDLAPDITLPGTTEPLAAMVESNGGLQKLTDFSSRMSELVIS